MRPLRNVPGTSFMKPGTALGFLTISREDRAVTNAIHVRITAVRLKEPPIT
jgi:hypothetical protein